MTISERKIIVSYCMLDLVDLCGTFARTLYISSALGAVHGNGSVTTSTQSFSNAHAACVYSVRWKFLKSVAAKRLKAKPPSYDRKIEPAWHRIDNIENISNDIALSNASQISNAATKGRLSLADAIEFRNFFAHRQEETLKLAKSCFSRYAITPVHSVEESLLIRVPRRSYTVAEAIIADIRNMIDTMAR
jgi:hypothetical protein